MAPRDESAVGLLDVVSGEEPGDSLLHTFPPAVVVPLRHVDDVALAERQFILLVLDVVVDGDDWNETRWQARDGVTTSTSDATTTSDTQPTMDVVFFNGGLKLSYDVDWPILEIFFQNQSTYLDHDYCYPNDVPLPGLIYNACQFELASICLVVLLNVDYRRLPVVHCTGPFLVIIITDKLENCLIQTKRGMQ